MFQVVSVLSLSSVNFSRIVPHGLLVFFPSYPVMYSCMDSWRVSIQSAERTKLTNLIPRLQEVGWEWDYKGYLVDLM